MPQSNQGDWEVIGEEPSTLPSFGKAPALKAVSPVATGKLASKAKSDWEIVGEEPLPPGFFERFSQSYGIPTTKSELKEALKQHVVGTILGPAYQMPVQALSYAQTVSGGLKTAYQEAKEAGENIGAGLPPLPQMGKVAYGTTQAALKAIPFIGGTISTAGEDWAKRNYWGAIGGLTGVVSQLAFLKSKDIKSTPPEIKGYYHTIRALTGTRPDFPEHIERLVARGHLREFATKFKPQTVRKGEASLREYMNQWEGVTINPAIARHPSATISGDLIAADIQTLKNPALDALFPENTPVIDAEMTRYQGKTVLLSDVAGPTGLLAKLNAMSKTLQAMSPENKAAAEHANVARAVVDKVTTAVRNQLYGTLESLGETGIREAQRDYGSMRELQEAFRRNIPKAERAEAIKPTYKGIPGRAIQRHPLLTGGFILGGIAMPHAWPAMGALPAIEAITTFKERAAVPNVQLRKAMEAFAKGPKRAPLPSPPEVAPSTPPTTLLPVPGIPGKKTAGKKKAEISTLGKTPPAEELMRVGKEGMDFSQSKPHGIYFTIGTKSPHLEVGDVRYTATATGKNILEVPSQRSVHARFGGMKGELSAGVSALKQLVGPLEFKRLSQLDKPELIGELNQKFPGPDYSRYYDSYELLEAYGAQEARAKGYDAVRLIDPTLPEFSEYVALTPDAFKVGLPKIPGKAKKPKK